MKKIIIGVIVLGLIALFGYMYATRPIKMTEVETSTNENISNDSETVKTYKIDEANSNAEFHIGEILNGKPFEVIGTTDQITGEVSVDISDLTKSGAGIFKVNAQTLKTDAERRDSAIARFILKSEDPKNQFVTFEPKSTALLPQDKSFPGEYNFTITGDLTIAGIKKETTFTAKANASNLEKITGKATATIKRADFNLVIPKVPFIASADEEVDLILNFTLIKK